MSIFLSPRPRVLVVDDCPDMTESLRILLGVWGYEVRTAAEGPAALTLAAAFRPDVVLLDIGLPGLDGYQVARRLRRLPGLENVFLVALTGYGQERDYRHSREAGFDQHLVKPCEMSVLGQLLESRLAQPVG